MSRSILTESEIDYFDLHRQGLEDLVQSGYLWDAKPKTDDEPRAIHTYSMVHLKKLANYCRRLGKPLPRPAIENGWLVSMSKKDLAPILEHAKALFQELRQA